MIDLTLAVCLLTALHAKALASDADKKAREYQLNAANANAANANAANANATNATQHAGSRYWNKTALEQPYPQARQHWTGVLAGRVAPQSPRFRAVAAESMAAADRALTAAQDARAVVWRLEACMDDKPECDPGE